MALSILLWTIFINWRTYKQYDNNEILLVTTYTQMSWTIIGIRSICLILG